MNWALLFLRASRTSFIPASLRVQSVCFTSSASCLMLTHQLNKEAASLKRGTLKPISLFGTASSRPTGRSAAHMSGASRPPPKVPSGPSTLLRFKHMPSAATLDHLLDLFCQYGRVLRVQSRKSTQVSTFDIVLMYYPANPIDPASDLVFVEFEKEEDAVRAKESIGRDMEHRFDWKDQEKLATRRLRWKGHPPPQRNRPLQISFAADLPVHHRTPPNARLRLQLRGLPPDAESAIEIAMRLSQSQVCQ